jgi:hypothetical protein
MSRIYTSLPLVADIRQLQFTCTEILRYGADAKDNLSPHWADAWSSAKQNSDLIPLDPLTAVTSTRRGMLLRTAVQLALCAVIIASIPPISSIFRAFCSMVGCSTYLSRCLRSPSRSPAVLHRVLRRRRCGPASNRNVIPPRMGPPRLNNKMQMLSRWSTSPLGSSTRASMRCMAPSPLTSSCSITAH